MFGSLYKESVDDNSGAVCPATSTDNSPLSKHDISLWASKRLFLTAIEIPGCNWIGIYTRSSSQTCCKTIGEGEMGYNALYIRSDD